MHGNEKASADMKGINQPISEVEFGVNEKVVVTKVATPSLFYVQKVVDKPKLVKLNSKLQLMKLDKLPVEDLTRGQLVCSEGLRGRVKAVGEDVKENYGKEKEAWEAADLEKGKVMLEYIDSGRVRERDVSDLYILPEVALMDPPFAVPCSLK